MVFSGILPESGRLLKYVIDFELIHEDEDTIAIKNAVNQIQPAHDFLITKYLINSGGRDL